MSGNIHCNMRSTFCIYIYIYIYITLFQSHHQSDRLYINYKLFRTYIAKLSNKCFQNN